ncbi:MAG: aminoacyl-tRNA hydrolase [Planctomycetota bacterium]
MMLIVGLGNPGSEYDRTRHNAGFMVVDELARRWAQGAVSKSRFSSVAIEAPVKHGKCLMLKPTTYMNRSGQAAGDAVRFFKLEPAEDVVVVVDDHALPIGAVRVRASGGSGGHNGLKDLDRALGGQDYPRVRVGIGAVPRVMNMADWVLSRVTEGEWPEYERSISKAADAVEICVSEGVEAAMNRFNEKVKPEKPDTHPGAQPATEDVDPGWLGKS